LSLKIRKEKVSTISCRRQLLITPTLINQGFDIKPLLDLLKECGLNKKVDDYNRLFACYNLLNNSDNSQLDVINKKGSPAVIDKNDACSYNQAVGNLAIRLSALMKWQKIQ
jgi:hypothetical protein